MQPSSVPLFVWCRTVVNVDLRLTVLLWTVPKYVPDADTVGFDGAGCSETIVKPAGGGGMALLAAVV
jgi:hypothetical protein